MRNNTLCKQLTWFYNRKARIEYSKFRENLKPKALPFDRITMRVLRGGWPSPDGAIAELIDNYAGNKKLKNLLFSPKQAYLVYKELNEMIPRMRDGEKKYIYG